MDSPMSGQVSRADEMLQTYGAYVSTILERISPPSAETGLIDFGFLRNPRIDIRESELKESSRGYAENNDNPLEYHTREECCYYGGNDRLWRLGDLLLLHPAIITSIRVDIEEGAMSLSLGHQTTWIYSPGDSVSDPDDEKIISLIKHISEEGSLKTSLLSSPNQTFSLNELVEKEVDPKCDVLLPPPSRSSFLGLPTELRMMIYDYLLPDQDVPPCAASGITRSDNRICHTAIIRANREIYNETLEALYSRVSFQVHFMDSGISRDFMFLGKRLLGHAFYHAEGWLGLQYIKSLHLILDISHCLADQENHNVQETLTYFVDRLPRKSKLQKVRVDLIMMEETHDVDFEDFEDFVYEDSMQRYDVISLLDDYERIEMVLRPLESLRNLKELEIALYKRPNKGHYPLESDKIRLSPGNQARFELLRTRLISVTTSNACLPSHSHLKSHFVALQEFYAQVYCDFSYHAKLSIATLRDAAYAAYKVDDWRAFFRCQKMLIFMWRHRTYLREAAQLTPHLRERKTRRLSELQELATRTHELRNHMEGLAPQLVSKEKEWLLADTLVPKYAEIVRRSGRLYMWS